jgi:hypothetical protein
VLFDTKITDLDSFEIAAWKFMHPRQEFDGWAPDGSCYRIGRKNYQQLFSGNTKQLWIDQRIAVETQVQIDLGVPEEVARSVARSVLEGRYNNLAERDYRDIAWAWREKLESELGNDGWVTSHCFAHVRDQMQSKVATNYHEPMSKEELQSVVTKRTQEFLTEQLAYLKRQENKGAPIVPENVLNDQRTRARFITNTISDIFYRLTDKQTGNANFVQEVRDDAEAKEFILKQFSKVLNKEDWAIRRMVMLCSLSNEMKHVKYGKCLPFSLALCTGEFWKWLFQDYAADMDNDQVLI